MSFIWTESVFPARNAPQALETRAPADQRPTQIDIPQHIETSRPVQVAPRHIGGLENVPIDLITRLSVTETEELSRLLEALPSVSRTALTDALNESAQAGSKPVILEIDSTGMTLMNRLYELATEPMHEAFTRADISRDDVVRSVLDEVLRPGGINQSSKRTCAATSMQYMLVVRQPAEFVRLIKGLTSAEGKVDLANGETLSRVADSVQPDTSRRSVSERLFQSAMMEFANPGKHSNEKDLSITNLGFAKISLRGMGAPNQALNALFNDKHVSFRGWFGDGSKTFNQTLQEAIERTLPQAIYCTMNWKTSQSEHAERREHAVVITGIRDGRIFFRNPFGASVALGLEQGLGPERKIEDAVTGLESMKLSDFLRESPTVYIPEASMPGRRGGTQAVIRR